MQYFFYFIKRSIVTYLLFEMNEYNIPKTVRLKYRRKFPIAARNFMEQ